MQNLIIYPWFNGTGHCKDQCFRTRGELAGDVSSAIPHDEHLESSITVGCYAVRLPHCKLRASDVCRNTPLVESNHGKSESRWPTRGVVCWSFLMLRLKKDENPACRRAWILEVVCDPPRTWHQT